MQVTTTDKLEILTSAITLILMTAMLSKYFFASQVITGITIYSLLVSLVKPVIKKDKLHLRAINVAHVIAKILTLVAFFIVIDNVFVMKTGNKNCSSCTQMSALDIAYSIVFLIYYSAYSFAFIFFSYISEK
ncbi:hypothetical protein CWI42_050700 [Ordospora colligata]|uniref:Uncharacterized protein n=1 Tax=Ordospora colligata OC4 TaxID=1354746 RepID=A0A0B2UF23_9MICR|nr:uncharacterized protein M896_050730 [Ordospora colligata OC4]KHN69666.1 hypothetical protein M896_050730 [Ordospora colligata OC4]TBU15785.1 hypothetical protein CWI41_050720 [Ordospora colligata]TBU15913.1 hypothetical protein CWI40_050740 [Ordospora colligata]TBU18807.1 hypothetical protein CWI42_050700 [Ordospora colligata]